MLSRLCVRIINAHIRWDTFKYKHDIYLLRILFCDSQLIRSAERATLLVVLNSIFSEIISHNWQIPWESLTTQNKILTNLHRFNTQCIDSEYHITNEQTNKPTTTNEIYKFIKVCINLILFRWWHLAVQSTLTYNTHTLALW